MLSHPQAQVDPNALELKDISKTFGQVQALDSIDLQLPPGSFTALIGPSGSGKSTLLKLASGLATTDPKPGSYLKANGEWIQQEGTLSKGIRKKRAKVGFIFQSFNLVGRLSLYQNALIGAAARNSDLRNMLLSFRATERKRAMQALHQVGLADKANQRASTLSGGQQQRGAIARAIVQGANLILADEPIASLDPRSAQRVMDTLYRLNQEEGITVLVTLHQVEIAKRYASRIVALSEGGIHFDGTANELDSSRLRSIYGDSDELETAPALDPDTQSQELLLVQK